MTKYSSFGDLRIWEWSSYFRVAIIHCRKRKERLENYVWTFHCCSSQVFWSYWFSHITVRELGILVLCIFKKEEYDMGIINIYHCFWHMWFVSKTSGLQWVLGQNYSSFCNKIQRILGMLWHNSITPASQWWCIFCFLPVSGHFE